MKPARCTRPFRTDQILKSFLVFLSFEAVQLCGKNHNISEQVLVSISFYTFCSLRSFLCACCRCLSGSFLLLCIGSVFIRPAGQIGGFKRFDLVKIEPAEYRRRLVQCSAEQAAGKSRTIIPALFFRNKLVKGNINEVVGCCTGPCRKTFLRICMYRICLRPALTLSGCAGNDPDLSVLIGPADKSILCIIYFLIFNKHTDLCFVFILKSRWQEMLSHRNLVFAHFASFRFHRISKMIFHCLHSIVRKQTAIYCIIPHLTLHG